MVLDYLISFGKVVASSLSPRTKAVLLNIVGAAGDTDGGGADEAGETAVNQEMYSALGIVARPRPPSKKDGVEEYAEQISFRIGDGLLPFAHRDLRLNRAYQAPKDGSIAMVGYGGGFHSLEDTAQNSGDQKATVQVFYVPYQFSNGVPAKAHVIVMDPTTGNESISIVHADGMAITMMHGGKNSVVIKNKAGNAYVEVNDDGVTVNGNTVINGGATIGSPTGAVPVALATTLAAYLTQLEADIAAGITAVGAGGAANGATGAATFTAGATARAPLAAAIPATLVKGL